MAQAQSFCARGFSCSFNVGLFCQETISLSGKGLERLAQLRAFLDGSIHLCDRLGFFNRLAISFGGSDLKLGAKIVTLFDNLISFGDNLDFFIRVTIAFGRDRFQLVPEIGNFSGSRRNKACFGLFVFAALFLPFLRASRRSPVAETPLFGVMVFPSLFASNEGRVSLFFSCAVFLLFV